jgi:plasmid maintenance system antidote protein VapI
LARLNRARLHASGSVFCQTPQAIDRSRPSGSWRIAEIVNNRRRITADTALRLSFYFGNSPEFWMNLQTHYDLKMARQSLDEKDIKRIKAQRAA